MAGIQSTAQRPFFKPLPEHDTIQTAYLLWKLSEKVEIAASGCWEWQGAKSDKGYGKFGIGGRGQNQTKFVHRTVYQLCVGETPKKMLVCHHCDNPCCCNPAHLFLGHHADNIRDCVKKGRHRPPKLAGGAHPNAKFTDDEVREIRRRVAREGRGSIKAIGEERGVPPKTISRIIRRVSYASVLDLPTGESHDE